MSRSREPAIVHVDTETIRAKLGVDELYEKPSITISACYAIPKASTSTGDGPSDDSREGWIVGEQLEKERQEAGFEGKWELRWPFRSSSEEEDWEGREFILEHVLVLLGITIKSNTHPLILIPPASCSFPISLQASYTQMSFEKLNTPSFALLPPSFAAIFALGQTTGIIVHVGYETTIVNIIVDSIIREECSTTIELGVKHAERRFKELLRDDKSLDRELKSVLGKEGFEEGEKARYIDELAHFVWEECTLGDDLEIVTATGGKSVVLGKEGEDDSFDVAKKLIGDTPAAASSHKSKKQQAAQAQKAANAAAQAQANAEAALAADVIICKIPSIPEKTFELGPVRHRLAEVLFRGTGGESMWEGIGRAVEHPNLGWNLRQSIWEGLGVVGDLARIKSFAPALTTYLSPFLVSSPELSEVQPSKLRLLSIPDYFANYKGATSDLAPFLGATISARMILSDTGLSITKIQYNAMGPAAIYTSKDEAK